MEDHHVDRPGVEARQRAQLTGPNRPIGSMPPPCAAAIAPMARPRKGRAASAAMARARRARLRKPARPTHAPGPHDAQSPPWATGLASPAKGRPRPRPGGVGRPGGHGGERTPDPIPNSAVKTPSAHDTAPQGAGKSVAARSPNPANPIARTMQARAAPGRLAAPAPAPRPTPRHRPRGVEQPGSSSGS